MGRWEEHGTGSQKPRAQCKEATAFVGEPRHSFRSLGAFAEDLHADPVPGKGEGKRSQPGQCQELVAQRGRDHVGILLTHEVGAGPGGKAEGGAVGVWKRERQPTRCEGCPRCRRSMAEGLQVGHGGTC